MKAANPITAARSNSMVATTERVTRVASPATAGIVTTTGRMTDSRDKAIIAATRVVNTTRAEITAVRTNTVVLDMVVVIETTIVVQREDNTTRSREEVATKVTVTNPALTDSTTQRGKAMTKEIASNNSSNPVEVLSRNQ